jgi:ATP-binding cassette, subfamily B, bacterial
VSVAGLRRTVRGGVSSRMHLQRSYLADALRTVLEADRRGAVLAFALHFLGAVAGLGLVLSGQFALTEILDDSGGPASLVPALVMLAAATSLAGAAAALQALQQRLLAERVSQTIWRRLLGTAAGVDLLSYESGDFNERLDRVRSNAVSRPLAVVTSSLGLIGSVITIVVLAFPVMALQPLLLPLLLLAGAPVVLLARRMSAAEFAFAQRTAPLNLRRAYLRALLTQRRSAAEIRAFEAGSALIERGRGDDQEYLAALTSHVAHRRRLTVWSLVASAIGLAAALGLIVVFLSTGDMTVPEAGAAVIATRLLGAQLSAAFRAYGTLAESGPFLQEVAEFFALHPSRAALGSPRGLREEIRVEGVSFFYPGAGRAAISDVSLSVPKGSVVALVGENGSGKTTLAKIIGGLFEPGEGRVTWDGEPISVEDRRASTSVLLQDHLRYLMPVIDNVAISDMRRPVDHARVLREIERVGLTSAVDSLRQGIQTVLGMELGEGSDLSGGQWQRLALARALYRDASLLILDEPSAALDPRAEYELFQDVRRLLNGRSAVLISHRYSSVRLADFIVVMEDGRVLEAGDHQSLMTAGGRYAELYSLQAESFQLAPDGPSGRAPADSRDGMDVEATR